MIPGLGVIAKDEFNEKHLKHLKAYAKENDIDFNKIVKSNFDIVADDNQYELHTDQPEHLLNASSEATDGEDVVEENVKPAKRKRRTKAEIEADKAAE